MASDGRIAIDFVSSKIEVVQYKGGLTRSGEAGQIIEQDIQREDKPVNKDEQKLATRSLYEQLTANKQAAEEAAKTKERDSMLPRGLDEEDIDFLDHILDQQAESEHQAAAQAQIDKEVFEAQMRAVAEKRAAEAEQRARANLLGTAPAALLKGPFRPTVTVTQTQTAEPSRKRPAEQDVASGLGAVRSGGEAAPSGPRAGDRAGDTGSAAQASSNVSKRVRVDGPPASLPSFAAMLGGGSVLPHAAAKDKEGGSHGAAGGGLVGYGSDSDED